MDDLTFTEIVVTGVTGFVIAALFVFGGILFDHWRGSGR